MKFKSVFKRWFKSIFRLLTLGTKRKLTDAQRRRAHERRLKAKHSSSNKYRIKKRRQRRRSSNSVEMERTLGALLDFIWGTAGLLLSIPFALADWMEKCAKAVKKHKKKKNKKTKNAVSKNKSQKESNLNKEKSSNKEVKTPKKEFGYVKAQTKRSGDFNHSTLAEQTKANTQVKTNVPETVQSAEPDENIPKSVPQNAGDRYIRKRLIIAGSYYCEQTVLNKLEIGSHITMEAEPDNPYDKNAVKLLFDGEKIGYIAKQDVLPYATCLRLNRKVYGIITAIVEQDGKTKYEYETWFDSSK